MMMRALSIILLCLLFSVHDADAKPSKSGSAIGDVLTVTFAASDSADSDAFEIMNMCSARASIVSGDVIEIRSVSTGDQAASTGKLLGSFSSSTEIPLIITSGTRYVKLRAISSTAGGSQVFINCSGSQVISSINPYGLTGYYMTPGTLFYMANMKSFEGLDPTIPWTHYWINPYTGSDSNPGTRFLPIRTLGKWKTMADYATWFHIQNGNRDRPMYISNQTFDFPASKTCVIGETVTYNTPTGTAKVLDVDYAALKIVFETLTGSPIATSSNITAASESGSACTWTVGTRRPTLWDTVNAPLICDSAAAPNSTSCTGRATQGSCAGGQICVASASAAVNLTKTPTRFDQRIVSLIDADDWSLPPIIQGDQRTIGDLNSSTIGANSVNRDNGGVFFARNSNAYGCLGVANIWIDAIADDNLVQSDEGCVKGLNLRMDRVWNFAVTNGKNNNVVTTHDGASGRGFLSCINCSGSGWRIDASSGPPIAPTGSSSMILIGNGDYITDATIWNDATNGTPVGQPTSVFGGTGGKVVIIGHNLYCLNTSGASTSWGCNPVDFAPATTGSSLSMARVLMKQDKNTYVNAVSLNATGNTLDVKIYNPSWQGGRGIAWFASAANLLSIDVRGSIFDSTFDGTFYLVDASGANNQSRTTVNIQGVYNNDSNGRFFLNNNTYNTLALARANAPTWHLFDGTYSRSTSVTEVSTDGNRKCLSTGQCWDTYGESYIINFPKPLYDYLPVPILGYSESGTRNYGAR